MTHAHNWMAMIVMPVQPEQVTGTDRIDVSHTELAEELAREDAKVICWACDTVLTTESFATECEKVPAKLL